MEPKERGRERSRHKPQILIRQFDEDYEASEWADARIAEGYALFNVSVHSVLVYDPERQRQVAEHAIVVTVREEREEGNHAAGN